MLRPRRYPEMIGKALVLEADPFITMVDDDEPWAEGLFMLIVVGFVVGLARFLGGLLLTLSLPPSAAMVEALAQGWEQVGSAVVAPALTAAGAELVRQGYAAAALLGGFGGGWARLLVLITTPMGLVVQWLIFALIGHGVARALGGRGTLDKTLGATALMVAPQSLRLLSVIPFVSVSTLLLLVWSLLIGYRALAVAHDLAWQEAMWAALMPVVAVVVLVAAGVGIWGISFLWSGI